jgi:hypothetical protein
MSPVKKYGWIIFYFVFLILLAFFLFNTSDEFKEIIPASKEELKFDVTRALEYLREINRITEINGGRRAGTDGSLETAAYIDKRLREAGIERVESQEFKGGTASLRNILAWLPGKGERQIVIAAHHDTAWEIPGVIDNASGVAVVLVLAEILAGKEWNHTLLLASFDGEEQGTLGSEHFVENLSAEERGKIDAMISVESVGWKDGDPALHVFEYDRPGRARGKEIAPGWLVRGLLDSAQAIGEDLYLGDKWISLFYQVTIRMGEVGFYSDDYPFVSYGIPGLFLSCFYLTNFYPEYHTGQDSLDQLGEDQLASAGRIVEASFYFLDRLGQKPQGQQDYLFLFRRELTGKELKILSFVLFLLIIASSLTIFWRGTRFSLVLWLFLFAILFWYSVLLADTVVFFYYFFIPSLIVPILPFRKKLISSIFFVLSILLFLPLFTWLPYLFYAGFIQSITLPLWQIILFFFLLLVYIFLFFIFMTREKPAGNTGSSDKSIKSPFTA